jgi:hypothetical protein
MRGTGPLHLRAVQRRDAKNESSTGQMSETNRQCRVFDVKSLDDNPSKLTSKTRQNTLDMNLQIPDMDYVPTPQPHIRSLDLRSRQRS